MRRAGKPIVFVGYSYTLGFVVCSTMAGLGRKVGVSRHAVKRRMRGTVNIHGKGGLWVLGQAVLQKGKSGISLKKAGKSTRFEKHGGVLHTDFKGTRSPSRHQHNVPQGT